MLYDQNRFNYLKNKKHEHILREFEWYVLQISNKLTLLLIEHTIEWTLLNLITPSRCHLVMVEGQWSLRAMRQDYPYWQGMRLVVMPRIPTQGGIGFMIKR